MILKAPDWLPPRLKAELVPLLALLGIVGALWLFAALAGEVVEGDTDAFDRAVLLALRSEGGDPLGPLWLEITAREITSLGSYPVLVLALILASGYLLLTRQRGAALLLLVSTAGGMAVSTLLKLAFDRPRPDLVPHLVEVHTASFPSGHAMLSAVAYLTLGALLMRFQKDRAVKAYILAAAVLVTLLVGASRIYLGVHWPTDVLAGWTVGAAWAALCWIVAWRLERRRGGAAQTKAL